VLSVFISKTAGAEALNMSIREGDFIGVTGTISEYKGEKEIKVERKEDIILNNPSQ
jgi:DNA/RNA endonuclease YhcR with UshA esterase domain